MTMKSFYLRSLILVIFFTLFTVTIFASYLLSKNVATQEMMANLGYAGVLFTAIIAGLNAIVPIPAATFTPVFTAAGLDIPLIIISLTIGTVVADFVGHLFGKISREAINDKYPKNFAFFTKLQTDHSRLIFPAVLLYAALIPFPNEAIIIPLALSGVRFSILLIPLLLGNFINQTLLVYGFGSIFGFLF